MILLFIILFIVRRHLAVCSTRYSTAAQITVQRAIVCVNTDKRQIHCLVKVTGAITSLMFKAPEIYQNLSVKLSDVLDEIGVNETMVMNRRRTFLLRETMDTVKRRVFGNPFIIYYLGSQSEGTTTLGLQSDWDILAPDGTGRILQDWSEWSHRSCNLLMIKDEKTPPGYCLLQQLRSDVPVPDTADGYDNKYWVTDTHGRLLLKNTILHNIFHGISEKDEENLGPARSIQGRPGIYEQDIVYSIQFKSWPKEARTFLSRQGGETWPTEDMIRYIEGSKCFVVGTDSKVSENAGFEWRISTSLAERCLMFSLNITQVKCYVLLKMILKNYINPQFEGVISSFICKTVLLHCIRSKHPSIWKEDNLLNVLSYCLLTLHFCILNANCPHFFIKGNNLMAGKFSYQKKHELIELTLNLVQNISILLYGIQTDDLGLRLQNKLNTIPQYDLLSGALINAMISGTLIFQTAQNESDQHKLILLRITHESLEANIQFLRKLVSDFIVYQREGNDLEKRAYRLLTPLFCTSLGSMIAAYNIQHGNAISPLAYAWFSAGLNSDLASNRLKLASVLYRVRDLEQTLCLLTHIRDKYEIDVVVPTCTCCDYTRISKERFLTVLGRHSEEAKRRVVAFCVRFLPSEINCVPKELQYEMFRSTEEDRVQRLEKDGWMDWAEIDSLPYLYFLQYKTFGQLHRYEEQQHALNSLVWVTENDRNLCHRETALNLLGQCMEQENLTVDALRFYRKSLSIRQRNNAASILICVLLSKLINNN
ncbi:uncharacterized protein LOC123535456 [Mercenaria mercenaria]|uniref:uncharacterized protein LOC123535456 n=1 Tax=Mercenaria mercenaria TaxID=6596 RepID=UPI00234F5436|nr:uncharacterized protein LOC123535456 [Mercenaria mercenaria]